MLAVVGFIMAQPLAKSNRCARLLLSYRRIVVLDCCLAIKLTLPPVLMPALLYLVLFCLAVLWGGFVL